MFFHLGAPASHERFTSCIAETSLVCCFSPCLVRVGACAESERSISLAEGKVAPTAPENWGRKKPKSNIIEFEYAVPPAKGTKTPAA